MGSEEFKAGDELTWTEETRDGPVARVATYQHAETLGGERCGVLWTHPNGAAMVIALHRLRRATHRP